MTDLSQIDNLIYMATDKQLATKSDLAELGSELRFDFGKLEKTLKQKMSENTDKVLKSNDDLIKELKDFRDEQAAGFDNYKRLDSKVEKHENYIEKADKKLKIGFKPD